MLIFSVIIAGVLSRTLVCKYGGKMENILWLERKKGFYRASQISTDKRPAISGSVSHQLTM